MDTELKKAALSIKLEFRPIEIMTNLKKEPSSLFQNN